MGRPRPLFSEASADCGPAALAFVAAGYGRKVSVASVRQLAGTSSQGTDFFALRTAAEALGFEAHIGYVRRDNFVRIGLPAICHMGSMRHGHYVVLQDRTSNEVSLADPVQGPLQLSLEAFFTAWSGHVMLLIPTPALHVVSAPAFSAWSAIRASRKNLGLVLVGAVVQVVSALGAAMAAVHVVMRPPEARWLVAGLICAAALSAVAWSATERAILSIAHDVGQQLTQTIIRGVLNEPLEHLDNRLSVEDSTPAAGALRLESIVAVLRGGADAVRLLVQWAAITGLDFRLGVATAMTMAVGVGVHRWSPSVGTARAHAASEARRASGRLGHAVMSARFVRSMAAPARLRRRIEALHQNANQLVTGAMWASIRSEGWIRGISALLYSGAILWMAAVAPGDLRSPRLLIASMLAVWTIATGAELSASVPHITDSWHDVLASEAEQDAADVERVRDAHQSVAGVAALQCCDLSYVDRSGVVRIQHVTFEVSLGEVLGITGGPGSGKTTLAHLLAGLYPPSTGTVVCLGEDVLRRPLGGSERGLMLIPEDPVLVAGTIRDMVIGKHIDERALRRVEQLLGLDLLVASLPLGYDTAVGTDGRLLSRSQREIVLLARALVQDPPVLVWDYGLRGGNLVREQTLFSAVLTERRAHGGATIVLGDEALLDGRVDRAIRLPARSAPLFHLRSHQSVAGGCT